MPLYPCIWQQVKVCKPTTHRNRMQSFLPERTNPTEDKSERYQISTRSNLKQIQQKFTILILSDISPSPFILAVVHLSSLSSAIRPLVKQGSYFLRGLTKQNAFNYAIYQVSPCISDTSFISAGHLDKGYAFDQLVRPWFTTSLGLYYFDFKGERTIESVRQTYVIRNKIDWRQHITSPLFVASAIPQYNSTVKSLQ